MHNYIMIKIGIQIDILKIRGLNSLNNGKQSPIHNDGQIDQNPDQKSEIDALRATSTPTVKVVSQMRKSVKDVCNRGKRSENCLNIPFSATTMIAAKTAYHGEKVIWLRNENFYAFIKAKELELATKVDTISLLTFQIHTIITVNFRIVIIYLISLVLTLGKGLKTGPANNKTHSKQKTDTADVIIDLHPASSCTDVLERLPEMGRHEKNEPTTLQAPWASSS